MDVLCIGETLVDIITRPVSNTFFNNDSTNVQEILLKTGGDALEQFCRSGSDWELRNLCGPHWVGCVRELYYGYLH